LSLAFQFAVEIEQYGESTVTLPGQTGFFWAFPSAVSTPADKDWEIGLFLPYSKNVGKIKASYLGTGELSTTIGARPSATLKTGSKVL